MTMTFKKMATYLLLGTLALNLTACRSDQTSTSNSKSTNSSVTKTETTEAEKIKYDTSAYQTIIDQYAQTLTTEQLADPNLNSIVLLAVTNSSSTYSGVFSSLMDINKDGIEELLIGLGLTQGGGYQLLDIYSLSKDNQPVKLTTADLGLDMIGERMTLAILANGGLQYHGSSSAFDGTVAWYELSADSQQLVKTKEFTYDSGNYTDTSSGKTYSQEEFDALNLTQEPINLSKVLWNRVTSSPEDTTISKDSKVDMAAVLSNDFSSLAGNWTNAKGDTITIERSGAVDDWGTISVENARAIDGSLQASVRAGFTGASFVLAPSGVVYPREFTLDTDTSRDRIYMGQVAPTAEDIYYRD